MPSDKIKKFRNEILEAGGTHLASMSSVGFPDAESVSNAITCVLSIVVQYELVGRWVTVCDDQRDSPCKFFACFLY